MSKQYLKTKSKRISCRKRYKIERKVRQHNKKVRKQAKKNPKKKHAPKDPGVPNSLPFKDKILKEAQLHKQMEEELKKKQKEERTNLKMENRGLTVLTADAVKRAKRFEEREALRKDALLSTFDCRAFKPFYREFQRVVEAADVILEVLDARDPLGSRCPQVEKAVLDAGPNKRLVLVLNKIDLIPNENLVTWLKYLRGEFPTVPFKASTQTQKENLSRKRYRHIPKDDTQSLTPCLGAELLMKLLGNYCRSRDIRTSICVGVVGFPNVGKSSIVNSLKRSRACNVGAVPGVTRKMQEVQLDKHIMLLDSPGVVLAQKNTDEAGAALRNAIKVENVNDAIPAVEAILRRVNIQQLVLYYQIPTFDNTQEFLALLAKRFGRLLRHGIPNVEVAAKNLIRDWTTGKIRYYTQPPVNEERPVHLSAEIVSQMASEFDIESLENLEKDQMTQLQNTMPVSIVDAIETQGCGFTAGTTEGLDLPSEENEVSIEYKAGKGGSLNTDDDDVQMNEDSEQITDVLGQVQQTKVKLEVKKKVAARPPPSKKTKAAVLDETGMKPAESLIPGNMSLNAVKKQTLKKLRKRRKRSEKLADKLSENLLAAINLKSEDENYSFQTDFH